VNTLRRQYPHALLVDSGNLAPQADKCAALIEGMALMRYDLTGVGPFDLTVRDELLKSAKEHNLPVISVTPFERDATGQVLPYVIKEADGQRIGFTSAFVVGGAHAGPSEAEMSKLKDVLRTLRKSCDVVVLLSHLGRPTDEALAREVADERLLDVIIGGTDTAAESRFPGVEMVGSTAIVPTSVKGEQLGVLQISFGPAGQLIASAERQVISFDLPEDPDVAEIVKRVMEAERKQQAEAAMRVAQTPRYSSAAKCGACHEAQLADWQNQRHARAYDTLLAQNQLVATCLPCHSEHYRRTRRLPTQADAPHGVQCSSCHGAGLRHSERLQPDDVVRTPAEAVCRSCHTAVRDPTFDYNTDLPLVDHKP
jgi:2',3'-cyclic-nucleotide 2'-phosphodiesterase (5'-nucleotidase family)